LKLNADGTSNNSFNSNSVYLGSSRFNGSVTDVAVQNDSKVILAGTFINVSYFEIAPNNINNINYFLRLNSDGTPDQTFIINSSIVLNISGVYISRFSTSVSRIAIQSDGKILICGGFINYTGSAGGTTTGLNRFIRLNADGNEDRTFNDVATRSGTTPKFSGTVSSICVLSSGQILVGGAFTNYGAITGYSRLIILSSTGSIGASETSFITNAIVTGTTAKFSNGSITSIVQQADGKILIGGTFTNYGGASGVTRLIRLNIDGTLDTGFVNNATVIGSLAKFTTGQIESMTIDSDDGIIVCGTFDYSNNGSSVSHRRFIKLNSDGTLDSAFTNSATASSNFSATVFDCFITPDNKYMTGGAFWDYYGTSKIRNYDKFDYFVILDEDGNID
jgi:uncharacterized delta-60 repeat protein